MSWSLEEKGTVYLLRSKEHAGGSRETYAGFTKQGMAGCLAQHNVGQVRCTRAYKPFELAGWVENLKHPKRFIEALKSPEVHAGTKMMLERMRGVLPEAERKQFDEVNESLDNTSLRAIKMLYVLMMSDYAEEFKSNPITINLALTLSPLLIPPFPSYVKVQNHPCPWAGRPLPKKHLTEKQQAQADRRAIKRIEPETKQVGDGSSPKKAKIDEDAKIDPSPATKQKAVSEKEASSATAQEPIIQDTLSPKKAKIDEDAKVDAKIDPSPATKQKAVSEKEASSATIHDTKVNDIDYAKNKLIVKEGLLKALSLVEDAIKALRDLQ